MSAATHLLRFSKVRGSHHALPLRLPNEYSREYSGDHTHDREHAKNDSVRRRENNERRDRYPSPVRARPHAHPESFEVKRKNLPQIHARYWTHLPRSEGGAKEERSDELVKNNIREHITFSSLRSSLSLTPNAYVAKNANNDTTVVTGLSALGET